MVKKQVGPDNLVQVCLWLCYIVKIKQPNIIL